MSNDSIRETRTRCDDLGNGECWRCKKTSSMNFDYCPHCCEHPKIQLEEDYDEGVYGICTICGYNQIGGSEICSKYVGIKNHE